MTHRAESIMTALLTKVTGLTTTGANVARSRAYPVAADGCPALTLEMGADTVVLQNIGRIDRELDVRVIAHAKTTGQFDTVLNAIREEVHVALMTDYTQGLGYVIDTVPGESEEPELEAAEQNVGRQVNHFTIKYRHSLTDPGA